MRNGFVALIMLMSTAGIASAQGAVVATPQKPEVQVTPDQVIARLMFFDRNRDGRVALDELSERMQPIVARGDRGGDGALDAAEIRALAVLPEQAAMTPVNLAVSARYAFGDTVGQTSRMRIHDTIEDLRLAAPDTTLQAKRIGGAFADEMDETAYAHLRAAITPVLTPEQVTQFESDLTRLAEGGAIVLSNTDRSVPSIVIRMADDPAMLLRKYAFTPEQSTVAAAAAQRFKAELQLDDQRRSALVVEMSSVMTAEECDDFGAALARRPLMKSGGSAVISGAMLEIVMLQSQVLASGR